MHKKIEFDFGSKKKIAKAKKINLAKGLAFGAAAGSAIGALSGVLFAPKSGKETRQTIKDDVTDATKKVTDNAKDVSEKAVTGMKDLAAKATDLVNEKLRSRNCCCNEFDSEVEACLCDEDSVDNDDDNCGCGCGCEETVETDEEAVSDSAYKENDTKEN
jgi:gas vesicle protein